MTVSSIFTVMLLTVLYGGGFGLLWYQTNWKVSLAVFLIIWGTLLQVFDVLQRAGGLREE